MSLKDIELFYPVILPQMELAAIEVMRSRQIASGPKILELEKAFGAIATRNNAVSTNDLTSAILIALRIAGVCADDRVATVAFSCLQSNSAITHIGAKPVWIDVDPNTMSMSVEDLEKKIDSSVKAVMVYHIAGYPSDIEQISALCKYKNIPLIEDCNNAIGAFVNGQPVGSSGDFAVFSLYPNRQINGIDGGILFTPDDSTAYAAACLRRFGIDFKSFRDKRGEINPNSDVSEIGWSGSLNNLNAAVALAQMDTLNERISHTKKIANKLIRELDGLSRVKPVKPLVGSSPAYWALLVQSDVRDILHMHLKSAGIKSSILHQRNDVYSGFGVPKSELPGTEKIMNGMLAIPCGWWMSELQIDYLIRSIFEFEAKGHY